MRPNTFLDKLLLGFIVLISKSFRLNNLLFEFDLAIENVPVAHVKHLNLFLVVLKPDLFQDAHLVQLLDQDYRFNSYAKANLHYLLC